MAYYDSVGNEVSAFSQEDLDALELEKNEALTKAQEDLKTKEEELEKLKSKDLNFSNLRAQKDDAEKKAEALKNEIDEKLKLAKKEILEGIMKDHYSETLQGIAGDDEELKKKIEFHYNRFNDPASSKSEIDKKLRDAWSLATVQDNDNSFNTVISSGSVSKISPSNSNKKFSEEEKSFGKRLAASGGISLEDKDFN